LPDAALAARLHERSGLPPARITHVFMTSLDALHRRGLAMFEQAEWFAHETELEAARQRLGAERDATGRAGETALAGQMAQEQRLLQRCQPAPDSFGKGVDLFPLPGVTAGTCGLLLAQPRSTVLVCGDAVATVEHVVQQKVLPGCWNVEQAMESFREAMEIADILVPGRDNVLMNWRR
jgi:glyoxylase-like metal-dependent hydrolase (beta-lactamase superfamily II)